MIVDTSVWIEFLRPGTSRAADALQSMIAEGDRIVVPETVMLELLSGPTDELVVGRRQRMLEAFEVEPLAPLADSLTAATLQRTCRRADETVRSLGDCLVAATALRIGVPVLHRDRDFDVLARHCRVPTVSLLDASVEGRR